MRCEFCMKREAKHLKVGTLFGLQTNLCEKCHQAFKRTGEFPQSSKRPRRPRTLAPLPNQMTFDFLNDGHGVVAIGL